MIEPTKTSTDAADVKEWTLMFYFASDNPLAPNVVSQLKAIKNAGFHKDVNVITKFDPQTPGTPTHIFDVNLANKLNSKENGFTSFPGNNPFVRSLVMDKLWGNDEHGNNMRAEIARHFSNRNGSKYDPPPPPDENEPSPRLSLRSFLNFCATHYKARHYMLFILGHGLAVGNQMFLFDADADEASLSLLQFADELKKFKGLIQGTGELELLGFHSCSMSSLELAYELEGVANYMLASQGPNFVGSWPYREICIRVFRDQPTKEEPERPAPKATILKIFSYILSNSFDFQLAGYSFDLALCDLQQARATKDAINELSGLLIEGLKADDPLVRELILLAHWEAQSYWQENYTDLFDFCFCLYRRCQGHIGSTSEPISTNLRKIQEVCDKMIKQLSPSEGSNDQGLVVRSEFAGPEFQYSHGLSVFFPWSQPSDKRFWPFEYFTYAFKETGWGTFLGQYFKQTQRKSIGEEVEAIQGRPAPLPLEQRILGAMLPTVNLDPEAAILAVVAGEKAGGASALGPGEKAGGASALGPGEKAGGASALGPGEKAGGASALGPGEKAGGASALGLGEKAGGASALGPGEKAGGASAMGGSCECSSIKNYPKYTRRTSPSFFETISQAE